MVVTLLRLIAISLLLSLSAPASAHDPALSGIKLIFRTDDVVVTVITHISRMAKAEGRDAGSITQEVLDRAVQKRLHLRFDAKELVPGQSHIIEDKPNDLLTWQTINSYRGNNWEVLSRLYPEDPRSITVVTVFRDGQCVKEAALDAAHPDLLSSQPKNYGITVATRYLYEGIMHILSGPDHILFVLGLLLLGGSLNSLLRTITAFTVAHSITLSLAATGIFAPSGKIVEPLIALSIFAIAIENLRLLRRERSSSAPQRDFRPYYAFGFGLIHGFGFAGALVEVGLPQRSLWLALASFNIGVECGQAIIVLTVAPILARLATKQPEFFHKLVLVGSICIGAAGVFWFVQRLLTL